MNNTNKLLVCLIVILVVVILFLQHKENFIVLIDDENPIPSKCPEYLLTNGKEFYLHDSRKPLDGVNNPKKFATQEEVEVYLANNKCPTLPVKNMVVDKSNDDPTESYERECAKKIAPFNYRIETCIGYADSIDKVREYQNMAYDEGNRVNFDLEKCMVDLVNNENPNMIKDENEPAMLNMLHNFLN